MIEQEHYFVIHAAQQSGKTTLLTETRVQRIVEPVILGEIKGYDLLDDDDQYVLDLGLLRDAEKKLVPANPIYGEVIIRTLSFRYQMEK